MKKLKKTYKSKIKTRILKTIKLKLKTYNTKYITILTQNYRSDKTIQTGQYKVCLGAL